MYKPRLAVTILSTSILLAACSSDSTSTDAAVIGAPASNVIEETVVEQSEPENTPQTPLVPDSGSNTANNPDTEDTGSPSDPAVDNFESSFGGKNGLPAAIATGADLSGADDDSPTPTESLSRQLGPFVKDPSRDQGPPSTPTGLTLLLSAENWLEFSWVPSTDDQSVEGYEIYRDGVPVYTVRGDTGRDLDVKSWVSTSYLDCDYTHFVHCDGDQPTTGASHSYSVAAIDNEGQKSALSEAVVFELQNRGTTGVDLTNYTMVLDEEFNDDSLDRDIWKTSLPWGENEIINFEQQYFVNVFGSDPIDYTPFNFTGNTLQITGAPTPPDLLEQANNQPFVSGVITTQDHFKMTYGYVEMNAKVASGKGLLSTFYLFNQSFDKNQPEIDILEYDGAKVNTSHQTYHYFDSIRARSNKGEKHSSPTMETVLPIDLSNDFHTYSVLWEPELIVWYIDGVEVRRLAGVRVPDEPMNIIAHLVVGSVWIGDPDVQALPAVFEIDYIKAWQRQ